MTGKDQGDNSGDEQRLIRQLAELLNETGLSEIEIEKSGLKVRVARTLNVQSTFAAAPAAAGAPAATGAAANVDWTLSVRATRTLSPLFSISISLKPVSLRSSAS